MKLNLLNNRILMVDSYKASHWLQYPDDTEAMISYIESRGGRFDKTVFFGLQYFIKEYLSTPITREEVEQAKKFFQAHGEPFNYEGWLYIVEELGGWLPVEIHAVPEGTVVPTLNALAVIRSTDPKVFWIVSWLETAALRATWYGTTIATLSWHCKEIIYEYLTKTSDNPDAEIAFKLHDFGARGVSSHESAAIGGAAHLVNFMGSDTVEGILLANGYYNHEMAGFSIPAAEHSTMTCRGREGEVEAFRNMIRQYGGKYPLFAVVSDGFDIYNAISNIWGGVLKDEVINSGSTLVIRPDSGKPSEVILKCLELAEEKFGATYNTKGYKVLNHVRLIQGDGINIDSLKEILEVFTKAGYSATNVAFGMGGGLLQQIDRDTQKFAMKCCRITVDGVHHDVSKDPVTDPGKKSKTGDLDVAIVEGKWVTLSRPAAEMGLTSELIPVYRNGVLLADHNFEDVRTRARQGLRTEPAPQLTVVQ